MSSPYPTSTRSRATAVPTNKSSKPNNYVYRSARAVPPPSSSSQAIPFLSMRNKWRLVKMLLIVSALVMILSCVILPFYLMVNNSSMNQHATNGNGENGDNHHGITSHIVKHQEAMNDVKIGGVGTATTTATTTTVTTATTATIKTNTAKEENGISSSPNDKVDTLDKTQQEDIPEKNVLDSNEQQPQQQQNPPPSSSTSTLARGVSGLPISDTPALIGASRGKIKCDVNVDSLVYWNDPQGTRDLEFQSPFIGEISGKTKYITFEPDRGGWNNIRMNLEIIFIVAATTGRTLVLPPESPLYLLAADTKDKHRGFGDFFPLKTPEFYKRVPILTMEEFIQLEGTNDDGQFPIPEDTREKVIKSSKACDKRAKSEIACNPVFDYLRSAGLVSPFKPETCLIFDKNSFEGQSVSNETQEQIKHFCIERENDIMFFNKTIQNEPLIHFKSTDKSDRLLAHFYGYMLFTDSAIDNYYKRFVRDFLHYHDEIYCAAGKIILSLQEEGMKRGFSLDAESGGGFSSMHVRRGDLQYKKVKISAEEWNANLNDTWKDNEIIYIATDERDKTFFDPIKEQHDVKFLDDYWDMARLGDLDPNYMGMIDTIVASRGRVFGGTWFSTFSGYITRMRGYHGMSMKTSYYGWQPRRLYTHDWPIKMSGLTFSHEWPTGWVGIDGDKIPSKSNF